MTTKERASDRKEIEDSEWLSGNSWITNNMFLLWLFVHSVINHDPVFLFRCSFIKLIMDSRRCVWTRQYLFRFKQWLNIFSGQTNECEWIYCRTLQLFLVINSDMFATHRAHCMTCAILEIITRTSLDFISSCFFPSVPQFIGENNHNAQLHNLLCIMVTGLVNFCIMAIEINYTNSLWWPE